MSEAVLIAWNFAHRAATEACDRIKQGRPGCGTWDTVATRVVRDLEQRSSCLSEYEKSVVQEATIWFIEQYRAQHTADHKSSGEPAGPEMRLDRNGETSTQLWARLRGLWLHLSSVRRMRYKPESYYMWIPGPKTTAVSKNSNTPEA